MDQIRVVVQLISKTKETDQNNCKDESITEKLSLPMAAEVEIIDLKKIRLTVKGLEDQPATSIVHKMNFDYVNHVSEHCLNVEMSTLMDDLMMQRRNCCLIRFVPRRECDLTILYNLLVTDVNKRLQQLDASVHFIKVDYRDIMQDGSRNMLNDAINNVEAKRRSFELGWGNDIKSTTASTVAGAKDQFGSTYELLLWLLNDYRQKWSKCNGHEALEFHFFIMDSQQRMFKVKFALFNVYLDKMNSESRSKWHEYIEMLSDVGGNDHINFSHTPLTACLRSHFETSTESENGRTLLLFNVPTDLRSAVDTVELLQMADIIIKTRNKKNVEQFVRRHSFQGKSAFWESSTSSKFEKNKLKRIPRSVSFTIPLEVDEEYAGEKHAFALLHDGYSKKDFNTLSTWYRKIDETFTNACDSMKKYYEHRYNVNMTKICNDIRTISQRSIDIDEFFDDDKENDVDENFNLMESQCDMESIAKMYDNYKSSLAAFRLVSDEINCSNYIDTLRIYFETKRFELTQTIKNLKLKQLENMQKLLSNTIDEELSCLNLMLYRESPANRGVARKKFRGGILKFLPKWS